VSPDRALRGAAERRSEIDRADYLVLASLWDAKHSGRLPELKGQFSHPFESPNRFGLPAFYTLHGSAWKANRNGAFVNWHPHEGAARSSRPKYFSAARLED
jgi:hypothetical protein